MSPTALLADRRARIPFAIIGILLLVLSGTFVVEIETRGEQPPTLETDRAIEQTESAMQTALVGAVTEASEKAATQPLTETSETEFGTALEGGPESESAFDRYLAALVYLQAKEHFESAGQRVGDVETRVSLPDITDRMGFTEAIDRITIRPGNRHANVESGVVEVTVENVSVVAAKGERGEEIARQNRTVTASVATPLYELHDRTETFQNRLDADLFEPGFSQRFNSRLYALGWARGYAQYAGMPVTEVIANRHIVPSANDAIYRTQRAVFGAADPQLNNAIRRGWFCMAAHDAEGLYEGLTDGETAAGETLCEQSKWVFGEQATGDLPDAPGTMELLGNAPGMDAKQTIGVNHTASLPLRQLLSGSGEHSLDRVIERIFEVEVALDDTFETVQEPEFTHDPPIAFEDGRSELLGTTNERTTVSIDQVEQPDEAETYYEIEGQVRLYLNQTKRHTYRDGEGQHETTTTATGVRTIAFEITLSEETISPNANIDRYNRFGDRALDVADAYTYRPGPTGTETREDQTIPGGDGSDGFGNYAGLDQVVLDRFFGESVSVDSGETARMDRLEASLESTWEDAMTRGDLVLPPKRVVSLDPPDESELRRTVTADIVRIQDDASEITHTFARRDLLNDGSGTGPYGELRNVVSGEKRSVLHRGEPYANVGQKAIYEARYSYFVALESKLGELEAAHGDAMDGLDAELGDAGLDSALSSLQQGMTAPSPEPVSLESSSLTEEISYEVSGAPTYLVTENVTSEDVPPVGNDVDAFAPMAARNENHFKLPYDSVVEGLLSRMGSFLGLSDPDAELTFRMASDALQAGELATRAAKADDEYGDFERLAKLTLQFEQSVEEAISAYHQEVARQSTFQLYPGAVTPLCHDGSCTDQTLEEATENEGTVCDLETCNEDLEIPESCTEIHCALTNQSVSEDLYPRIATAVEEAVTGYSEETGKIAGAIDSGDIDDKIIERVFRELSEPSDRPAYAADLGDSEWRAVVESAVRAATTPAANEQTVSISDTGTVEALDREIRATLEEITDEMTDERFTATLDDEAFDPDAYDDWVGGLDSPLRVPAGMPIMPFPTHWFATVNVWDIEVKGEYARFEVTANVGTPETATATSYVREDEPVEQEIAGDSRHLGTVEPISVSEQSTLVVIVPPGRLGVGDRDDEDPEYSPTWPVSGDVSERDIDSSGEP